MTEELWTSADQQPPECILYTSTVLWGSWRHPTVFFLASFRDRHRAVSLAFSFGSNNITQEDGEYSME